MCIVAIAHLASDRYPLVVAANRDERHARSTAPAQWWQESPGILGGRDLVAGGTWLGVGLNRRFAAVTNVFEPGSKPAERSRGQLVGDFLRTEISAARYADRVAAAGDHYGPFNLLLLERDRLRLVSNRNESTRLEPGIHACSNNRPGSDWPKLRSIRTRLERALAEPDPTAALLDFLSGPRARGTLETAAESIFIVGSDFGTRCSTVLIVDSDGKAGFVERSFLPDGTTGGTVSFEFAMPVPPAIAST